MLARHYWSLFIMNENIICHIVAGFLGSGKSTFIKQLINYRPTHEKWAILVNEKGNADYMMSKNKASMFLLRKSMAVVFVVARACPFASH